MAVKTITIELDAYDLLKAQKKSDKESFSQVIRRVVPPPSTRLTGPEFLARMDQLFAEGKLATEEELDLLDQFQLEDRPPEDPFN